MKIEKAISELKNCGDFQGYHLGVQIEAGLSETVSMMADDGFTREEALAGIARYCTRIADCLRDGKEIELPYYREDEVKEYEAECRSCRYALCA